MKQNKSAAVMQQRGTRKQSLDSFPTHPWATRAFVEHVLLPLGPLDDLEALEPACGAGHMAEPLLEYFGAVLASDIYPYGYGSRISFLDGEFEPVDWVITNPPFNAAERFIAKGRRIARVGVAVLVRGAFLESLGRFERLYRGNPPDIVAQYVERVPMVEGRLDAAASSATSYCWLVWLTGSGGALTRLVWIPPSRERLTRPGDYDCPISSETL